MLTNIAYVLSTKYNDSAAEQVESIQKFLVRRGDRIHKIFTEKDLKTSDRPAFAELLSFARRNESIYVTNLSVCARTMSELGKVLLKLNEKKLNLYCIEEDIAFEIEPDGTVEELKLKTMPLKMFKILKNLSSISNKISRQEGLVNAKSLGVVRGRKAVFSEPERDRMIRMRAAGLSYGEIAEKFHSNRSTIFKYLSPYREEQNSKKEEVVNSILKEAKG